MTARCCVPCAGTAVVPAAAAVVDAPVLAILMFLLLPSGGIAVVTVPVAPMLAVVADSDAVTTFATVFHFL